MRNKENLLIGYDAIEKFLKVSADQFESIRRNKTHNGIPLQIIGSLTVADKDELAEWFHSREALYRKGDHAPAPPMTIDNPDIIGQQNIVAYLDVGKSTVQRYSQRKDNLRLPMALITVEGQNGNVSASSKKLLDEWKKLYLKNVKRRIDKKKGL